MSNTKTRFSVGVMTRIAILTAIASILFLIEIPVVAFYKLDLSNIPVLRSLPSTSWIFPIFRSCWAPSPWALSRG